jgi:hypothetical protein
MNIRCPNATTEPCTYPACGCHTTAANETLTCGAIWLVPTPENTPFMPMPIDMPGPDITDETVARIEASLGVKHQGWDLLDPKHIIGVVLAEYGMTS